MQIHRGSSAQALWGRKIKTIQHQQPSYFHLPNHEKREKWCACEGAHQGLLILCPEHPRLWGSERSASTHPFSACSMPKTSFPAEQSSHQPSRADGKLKGSVGLGSVLRELPKSLSAPHAGTIPAPSHAVGALGPAALSHGCLSGCEGILEPAF